MAEAKQKDRNCPACGSAKHELIEKYSLDEWRVVSCDDCNFVYLRNPPGYKALVEKFAWEKTSAAETQRRLEVRGSGAKISKNTRWRLRLFSRGRRWKQRFFSEGNVLDVGCGAGHQILDEGGTPYGIEISKELNSAANDRMARKGGYCVHAPAVEGITEFPENFFDSILLHSFLEHEEQPAKLLSEAFRVLKPSGIIYVRVPHYNSMNRLFMGSRWCGFRYPDHVNYFTIGSLKSMAAASGFRFRLLNWLNVFLDDNIKAVLVKEGTR